MLLYFLTNLLASLFCTFPGGYIFAHHPTELTIIVGTENRNAVRAQATLNYLGPKAFLLLRQAICVCRIYGEMTDRLCATVASFSPTGAT